MAFRQNDIDNLLVQVRRRCCICGSLHNVQVHHIVPLGEGGGDEIENAIVLCPGCHDRVHVAHSPGRTTRDYTHAELRKHRERAIQNAAGVDSSVTRSPEGVDIGFHSNALGFYGEIDLGDRCAYQKGCTFLLTFTNSGTVEANVIKMRIDYQFAPSSPVILQRRDKGIYGAPRVPDQLFLDFQPDGFTGRWLLGNQAFPGGPHRPVAKNASDLFESPDLPPMEYHLDIGEAVTIRGGIICEGFGIYTCSFAFLVSACPAPVAVSTPTIDILSGQEPK